MTGRTHAVQHKWRVCRALLRSSTAGEEMQCLLARQQGGHWQCVHRLQSGRRVAVPHEQSIV